MLQLPLCQHASKMYLCPKCFMHRQFVAFSSSPLCTQWLLRLHCVLLWLEAEVLDINAKTIIKPFQEAVGQSVLLFF